MKETNHACIKTVTRESGANGALQKALQQKSTEKAKCRCRVGSCWDSTSVRAVRWLCSCCTCSPHNPHLPALLCCSGHSGCRAQASAAAAPCCCLQVDTQKEVQGTQKTLSNKPKAHVSPGHGVKLLRRLPCVQKVQASIPARRMVPFFGAMALSLSVLLSGLCPCGASVRGRGFGHFASTKCHPV